MAVERFTPDHGLWLAFLAHLERVGMVHWVIQPNGQPQPDLIFLGMVEEGAVIGHISLQLQTLLVPACDLCVDEPIPGPDGHPLRETFVVTFAVDESHRHQGHGRALQIAALAATKAHGCYQMRSWSSFDKPINYALKLSMGFAVHPAVEEIPNGQRIGGVFFTRTV